MKGADHLMKLRLEGSKFELVQVWVGDRDFLLSTEWHKYSDTMQYPYIDIENSDNLDLLDFRFVVGLNIILSGDDSNRLLEVYSRMTKHKPRRLILIHDEDGLTQILDNKGLLSGILE
jgi:hypothetical protein